MPASFSTVHTDHPRRNRAARRMRALGWPVFAIARALRMPHARVQAALGGTALWSQSQIEQFRKAA